MGAGPQEKTKRWMMKAPAERGSAGDSEWDYFAKQDLARSADRSTWFLYSKIASS